MDGVQKLLNILETSTRMVVTDPEIIRDLSNCIEKKGKFKITINGFGGNLANLNVQVKTGKKTWIHASKNNSQPNGK
jgi:hypothetical protein